MRRVYRIALAKHARDLTGKGARLTGGRWNAKETAVLYTSESRSLAAMEYLVHLSLANIPPDIKIISIGIPDSSVPKQLNVSELPKDWRRNPAPMMLAEIGTRWALGLESLLLRVPSAVIMQEFNILINPAHPDMKAVHILDVDPFIYDERLRRAAP